ncbi:helix-turn-helix domain-containing protein [Kitasatospora aureofaciens]|uniref:helix-turn-helix domain-containing protein n=1 Tax=Kitasatospora aureofaciens TaxID=1894 RepID=UPI0033F85B60
MAEYHKQARPGGNGHRRPRLTSKTRQQVREAMAKAYRDGASIRACAEAHDRSYGQTRTLLLEAKVQLRGRGGAQGSHPHKDTE